MRCVERKAAETNHMFLKQVRPFSGSLAVGFIPAYLVILDRPFSLLLDDVFAFVLIFVSLNVCRF
jgi:uncharacterized protein YceK